MVVISALVVGLSVTGGFGIVGETEIMYEDVRVKNKVVSANGSYINFRDHISEDGQLVSGTVLLLRSLFCIGSSVYNITLFSCTNDLDDLKIVKSPIDNPVLNSTCVMEESGFTNEITRHESNAIQASSQGAFRTCSTLVDVVDVPKNDITRVLTSLKIDANCTLYIEEVWCSNFLTIYCVGSIKIAGGFGELHVFVDTYGTRLLLTALRTEKRPAPELLKSMAFLQDILRRDGVFFQRRMTASRI